MIQSQKLLLRSSEVRTRLNELSILDDQTDETRSEMDRLRGEFADIEKRYQSAVIGEDSPAVVETRAEDKLSLRG